MKRRSPASLGNAIDNAGSEDTGRQRTEPCPVCGALNSLTKNAIRLGNSCDDCLEADIDVGEFS